MSKLKISEDWTSTIVGWFIIFLVVFQLKPHWPSFSWPDADALMNKIFDEYFLGDWVPTTRSVMEVRFTSPEYLFEIQAIAGVK